MIGSFLHPSDAISRYSEDTTPASRHVWLIQELVCEIRAWFLALLLHLWGWSLGNIECIDGIDDDWNAKGCSLWIFLTCLTGPLAKKINYIIYGLNQQKCSILCVTILNNKHAACILQKRLSFNILGTSFWIFGIPLHHIAKVVVQQLLPIFPLVWREWHSVNAFAPPSIRIRPFCPQWGPNFHCLFRRVGDVPERQLAGVMEVHLTAMTFCQVNGIFPHLDPCRFVLPGPKIFIASTPIVRMLEFTTGAVELLKILYQIVGP